MITLSPLQKEDIELVRKWRNSPEIRQAMVYRDYIRSDDQLKWYDNLRPNKDYYFLVKYGDRKIGLANIKNVSKEHKSGEVGIFIGNKEFHNNIANIRAFYLLLNFGFNELKLETIHATVLSNNQITLKMVHFFGFSNICIKNNIVYLMLSSKDFVQNTKIIKYFSR